MNGSIPLHASLAYTTAAAEDPFDFDLFSVLAGESPPSLASAEPVRNRAPPPPFHLPSCLELAGLDTTPQPGPGHVPAVDQHCDPPLAHRMPGSPHTGQLPQRIGTAR